MKLDSVSYGYLINCFADSKKPRSALSAFHQMRKQNIEPSMHTYMGKYYIIYNLDLLHISGG